MEMAMVNKCRVSECSYNSENMCHALAITIGDEPHPKCDTFCQSSEKGGDSESVAVVGACKMASCTHNESLECQCAEIEVDYQEDEIDCLNYTSL